MFRRYILLYDCFNFSVSKINLEVSSSTNPDSFSVLHEVGMLILILFLQITDLPRPKEGKLQLQIAEFTSSVVMPIKHMKLVLEKPLSNVDFASIHQIVMR